MISAMTSKLYDQFILTLRPSAVSRLPEIASVTDYRSLLTDHFCSPRPGGLRSIHRRHKYCATHPPTHPMNKLALFLIAATAIAASAVAQLPGSAVPPSTPGPAAGAAAAKPKALLAPADKKWIKDVSEAVLIEQKFLELVVNNKTATFSEETKRTPGTMSGDLKRVWNALA